MADEVGVLTQCPDCGRMRLDARAVTLRHCLDDDAWSYRFTCPVCCRRTVVPTWASLALAGVEAGLSVESWTLPREASDGSAPPFTRADILDLHFALLDPEFVERLTDAGRGRAA